MTVQSPPAYLQGSSHPAAVFRQALTAILGYPQPGTLTSVNGGVVNAGDLKVAQHPAPAMNVDIAGGVAVVPQTQAANGGVYFGLNDATVTLTISASSPSNPRIDLVCATVDDAAFSGATNDWKLQVITGVASGSPTVPAMPAASIPLAKVSVAANAATIVNANITDLRTFAPTPATMASTLKVGRTTAFTVAASQGVIAYDTVLWDSASAYSTSTGKYTCPTAGKYLVTATLGVVPTASGEWVLMQLFQNSSGGATSYAQSSTNAANLTLGVTDTLSCAAGDTLWAQSQASTALPGNNITNNTYFTVHRLPFA